MELLELHAPGSVLTASTWHEHVMEQFKKEISEINYHSLRTKSKYSY